MELTDAEAARWETEYQNGAEHLFGKVDGDTLDQEQDEACVRYADNAILGAR
jgi:hypothetical protein